MAVKTVLIIALIVLALTADVWSQFYGFPCMFYGCGFGYGFPWFGKREAIPEELDKSQQSQSH